MPHHVHDAPGTWVVGLTIALAVLAVTYEWGWMRLRLFTPSPLPAWRLASAFAGLAAAWLAVASPIGAGDERLLTFHMVQHLLLMTIAPPLIFLGQPVRALWWGLFESPEDATGSFRGTAWSQIKGALGRPAVCWLAATATLVGWHIPAAFTVALASPFWHAVEQASFLVTGLLFWWPVVQPWPSRPDPRWSTVLYLFLATLPCDILSGFLVFSDRIAYPVYLSTQPALAVLGDQQCAGALMWTVVTIVYLVAGTILSTQLLASPSPRPLAEAI
ncbi:MAG TPA: cytochrome c oxidase assembly protein [Vicinamibacteria bacterium]